MQKSKEKGITLVALVITIITLIILASISINSGLPALELAGFNQFKNELKILQTKVNELNEKNEIEIGEKNLTQEHKNIISANISNSNDDIISGFRYCSSTYIKDSLGLESVERDYLINVQYRYVIYVDGYEYKGNIYYMLNQLPGGAYNVDYKDKNAKTGEFDFDVNVTKENNKWKIEIFNIVYNGYINNWQVKYKLEGTSQWQISDNLTFYLTQEGIYNINVIYEDEVDLGTKTIRVISEGLIADKVKNNIIKIGDYVQYEPDEIGQADTSYINLISDLQTYSGNTTDNKNTSETLKQESLNWRVLDVIVDEKGDSFVRLISEKPTTSVVKLNGAKGYNNGVYLLDKVCNILYGNSTYVKSSQSLKIEDIQKHLTYNYLQYINEHISLQYGKSKTYADKRYYPSIFTSETTGKVDGVAGEELNLSEQEVLIDEEALQAENNITVVQTYWAKKMESEHFINPKYQELFIKDKDGNNYSTYYLSSRCINTASVAYFEIRRINDGAVTGNALYHSNGSTFNREFKLRPVITLNSNVLIDVEASGDGLQAETAWVIK